MPLSRLPLLCLLLLLPIALLLPQPALSSHPRRHPHDPSPSLRQPSRPRFGGSRGEPSTIRNRGITQDGNTLTLPFDPAAAAPPADACDLQPCKLHHYAGPEPSCDGVRVLLAEAARHGTVPVPTNGSAVLIVPHAPMQYSGPFAASGYQAIRGNRFDKIVVVGFYHAVTPFNGIVVGDCDNYYHGSFDAEGAEHLRRLLGSVAMASCEVGVMRETGDAGACTKAEHSVEMQLPFIQTLFTRGDNMPLIVPVMLGSASPALTDTLATALDAFRQIIVGTNNPRVLYVFSSDLAHFFDEREERGLDRTTLQRIAQGDALDLEAYFVELANKDRARGDDKKSTPCGRGPIIAAVKFAQLAKLHTPGGVIVQGSSGVRSGDWDRVVGYGSVVFTTSAVPPQMPPLDYRFVPRGTAPRSSGEGGDGGDGGGEGSGEGSNTSDPDGVAVAAAAAVAPTIVDRFDMKSVLDAAKFAIMERVCTNPMDTGPDRSSAYGLLKEKALAQITSAVGDFPRGGVFVTLLRNTGDTGSGEAALRGCIGCVLDRGSSASCLGETDPTLRTLLPKAAALAATQDGRFSPVTKDEVSSVRVEVSLLGSPHAVPYSAIRQGDGVIFTSAPPGNNRGVFLPDVWGTFSGINDLRARLRADGKSATQEAVDALMKTDFMHSLAKEKAGVPVGELHKPGARFAVFSAQLLSDGRPMPGCEDRR